jgi:hypothetical protein
MLTTPVNFSFLPTDMASEVMQGGRAKVSIFSDSQRTFGIKKSDP